MILGCRREHVKRCFQELSILPFHKIELMSCVGVLKFYIYDNTSHSLSAFFEGSHLEPIRSCLFPIYLINTTDLRQFFSVIVNLTVTLKKFDLR